MHVCAGADWGGEEGARAMCKDRPGRDTTTTSDGAGAGGGAGFHIRAWRGYGGR